MKKISLSETRLPESLKKNTPEATPEFPMTIIGVGGCGLNTVNRFIKNGTVCGRYVAIDTDGRHLSLTNEKAGKILIGDSLARGMGTGGQTEMSRESAEKDTELLKDIAKDAKIVVIFAGLGGGTGTGATPIVADIAKKSGALTIVFATLPFSAEVARHGHAVVGLGKIQKIADAVILMDNNMLVRLVPNLPMIEAFDAVDGIIGKVLGSFIASFTKPAVSGIFFDEVLEVFKQTGQSGIGFIAWGEGKKDGKVKIALDGVFKNRFLNAKFSDATGIFVQITCGPDLTLKEATNASGKVLGKAKNAASKKWSTILANGFEGKLEISAIALGVPVPDSLRLFKEDIELFKEARKGDMNRIISLVEEKKANVNARENSNAQPIHSAAFAGRLEALKYLVEKGADVNSKGAGGSTPLAEAVSMSNAKVNGADYFGVIKFLIEKGADVNAPNSMGYPPLDFARNKQTIDMLEAAGAKHKEF